MSDPPRRPYARQSLDLVSPTETSLPGRVADIVEALLPGGRCSAVRVARSLGMDQRTLNRHLAQSGKTYSSILNSVRAELAKRYITRGDMRLTDVATELGFSELSAFSRWFRRQFGMNPMKWSAHQHIPS
jgi:AraC-like DNA-binding protein